MRNRLIHKAQQSQVQAGKDPYYRYHIDKDSIVMVRITMPVHKRYLRIQIQFMLRCKYTQKSVALKKEVKISAFVSHLSSSRKT